MSNKRKGFTLVEVIVVILVSTVLLTMVIGAMTYINNTIGDFIKKAEEIEIARNIEKHFRDININDIIADFNNENDGIDVCQKYGVNESSDLINESGEIIFYNTGLKIFKIYRNTDSNVVKCYMKFHSGIEFEFVVGIIDTKNGVSQ